MCMKTNPVTLGRIQQVVDTSWKVWINKVRLETANGNI